MLAAILLIPLVLFDICLLIVDNACRQQPAVKVVLATLLSIVIFVTAVRALFGPAAAAAAASADLPLHSDKSPTIMEMHVVLNMTLSSAFQTFSAALTLMFCSIGVALTVATQTLLYLNPFCVLITVLTATWLMQTV